MLVEVLCLLFYIGVAVCSLLVVLADQLNLTKLTRIRLSAAVTTDVLIYSVVIAYGGAPLITIICSFAVFLIWYWITCDLMRKDDNDQDNFDYELTSSF